MLGTIAGVVVLSIVIVCFFLRYKKHVPTQLRNLRQRIHLPQLPVVLRSTTAVTNNTVELSNYQQNPTEPQQPPPDFVRPAVSPVPPPPVTTQLPPPPYNPNIHVPPTNIASEKLDFSQKGFSSEIGFRTEEPPPYDLNWEP